MTHTGELKTQIAVFKTTAWFSQGPHGLAYRRLSYTMAVSVPGISLDWLTGKQAYIHLQKADRNMKELKDLNNGGVGGSQVSEKDLTVALGR